MSELLYPKINPTKYLDLASELAAKSDDAAKRSAADRAYYAAFLTCRDVLTTKNYFIPRFSSDDHMDIAEKLRNPKLLGIFVTMKAVFVKHGI